MLKVPVSQFTGKESGGEGAVDLMTQVPSVTDIALGVAIMEAGAWGGAGSSLIIPSCPEEGRRLAAFPPVPPHPGHMTCVIACPLTHHV